MPFLTVSSHQRVADTGVMLKIAQASANQSAISHLDVGNGSQLGVALKLWKRMQEIESDPNVYLTGADLDIPTMVACSKAKIEPRLADSPELRQKIMSSVSTLEKHLNAGHAVYGESSLSSLSS